MKTEWIKQLIVRNLHPTMFRKLTPVLQSCRRWQFPPAGVMLAKRTCVNPTHKVYVPDYLDSLKPKYPQYEKLNVAIKGYDFPILESYQRFLHSIAEYMDIDVADCYALPAQETLVQRLRPNSTVVDAEYKLTTYERNIEMVNVGAPILPLFIRVAQAALPEGVTLYVQEHSEECDERRYVPDRDLLELKAELERMGGSKSDAKKK